MASSEKGRPHQAGHHHRRPGYESDSLVVRTLEIKGHENFSSHNVCLVDFIYNPTETRNALWSICC